MPICFYLICLSGRLRFNLTGISPSRHRPDCTHCVRHFFECSSCGYAGVSLYLAAAHRKSRNRKFGFSDKYKYFRSCNILQSWRIFRYAPRRKNVLKQNIIQFSFIISNAKNLSRLQPKTFHFF